MTWINAKVIVGKQITMVCVCGTPQISNRLNSSHTSLMMAFSQQQLCNYCIQKPRKCHLFSPTPFSPRLSLTGCVIYLESPSSEMSTLNGLQDGALLCIVILLFTEKSYSSILQCRQAHGCVCAAASLRTHLTKMLGKLQHKGR